MYECKAENKIGLKSDHIELAGRPKPSIFKPSPVASLQTTYNFIWSTESFSPIIEYNLKFRQIPHGNIIIENRKYDSRWKELIIPGEASDGPIHSIGYVLRGLAEGALYEAAVASRNRYGWSDLSKIIRFHTGPEGKRKISFLKSIPNWFVLFVHLGFVPSYPPELSEYNDVNTIYYDDLDTKIGAMYSSGTQANTHLSIIISLALVISCLIRQSLY